MEAHQEIAKLLRRLAELVEQMGSGIIIAPVELVEDPAPSKPKTKWVTYCLELKQPIGKPKAGRIIERLATTPRYRDQLSIVMGQGTATRQAVVAFNVRVTDRNGDGLETASFMADKMNERGSDKRARAKVIRVVKVD